MTPISTVIPTTIALLTMYAASGIASQILTKRSSWMPPGTHDGKIVRSSETGRTAVMSIQYSGNTA